MLRQIEQFCFFRAICGIVGLALFVGTFHDIVLRYKRNKPDSEETTTPKNRSIELKSYQPREGHVYATSNGIPKSNPNGALNGHGAVNGHVSTDLENKDATFSQPAKILQVSNQKSMIKTCNLMKVQMNNKSIVKHLKI